MLKEAFVQKYYKYAKQAERQTGVPAIFALAQSALESGWGKHAPNNMLFGMKIGSGQSFGGWPGDSQLITTTEYHDHPDSNYPYIFPGYPRQTPSGKWKYKIRDYFRAYPSPYFAFLDWSGLLSKSSRYRRAMQKKDNPVAFAEEVAKAGYATSPTYAEKVKRLIQEISGILQSPRFRKRKWLIVIPITLTVIGGSFLVWYFFKKSGA